MRFLDRYRVSKMAAALYVSPLTFWLLIATFLASLAAYQWFLTGGPWWTIVVAVGLFAIMLVVRIVAVMRWRRSQGLNMWRGK